MESKIELPRIDKESGKPRVSYSQVRAFNDIESFNLKQEGVIEYIVEYFIGFNFADIGWGEFGHDTEGYIGSRSNVDKFTDKERETLETIEPLGVLGDKFTVDFGEFVLTGVIDDRLEDWSKIRDYKTASKNSKKQYYEPMYKQLDIYALKGLEVTGKIPELEVCIIERKGSCMFGKGRKNLTVGDEVWYLTKETSEERLEAIKEEIISTVERISEYYKLYKKLNK